MIPLYLRYPKKKKLQKKKYNYKIYLVNKSTNQLIHFLSLQKDGVYSYNYHIYLK